VKQTTATFFGIEIGVQHGEMSKVQRE
jgi:hypothetical protein